jgi:hypothetical protein
MFYGIIKKVVLTSAYDTYPIEYRKKKLTLWGVEAGGWF